MSISSKIKAAADKKAKKLLKKMVDFGLKQAQINTNRDTGALANSARPENLVETAGSISQDIVWGNVTAPNDDGELVDVDYQGFVAFGTSRQRASSYHITTLKDIKNKFKA